MIIYQMKKPIECVSTDCVGVLGDNVAYTQDFYIRGVSDDSISYTLHLRFSDGSVNSVTPDLIRPDGEGTGISWIVKKNDIFRHGYFEVQIEGRNKLGLVFQTEIVKLYADESLPVENKAYENPNSETLRLREEAYAALEEIKKQQEQIDANVKLIAETDLNIKADKATTLAGYGIADAYTKEESELSLSKKLDNAGGAVLTENLADKSVTTAKLGNGAVTAIKMAANSVSASNIVQNQITTGHLINGSVTSEKLSSEVNAAIKEKAKTSDLNAKLALAEQLASKVISNEEITDEAANYPSIAYLNGYYYKYDETDVLLAGKYNASEVEKGTGSLTVYTQSAIDSGLIASASFEYQKVGSIANIFYNIVFNEGSASYLQFTGLPFGADDASNQNRSKAITNKNSETIAYPVGSWLALNFAGKTVAFAQGETLKGVISIIIR